MVEDAAAAAAPAKETFRKSALGQTMLVGTIFLFVFSAYFMMQGYAALLFGPALASASLVTLYGVFAAACFVAPGIVNRHGARAASRITSRGVAPRPLVRGPLVREDPPKCPDSLDVSRSFGDPRESGRVAVPPWAATRIFRGRVETISVAPRPLVRGIRGHQGGSRSRRGVPRGYSEGGSTPRGATRIFRGGSPPRGATRIFRGRVDGDGRNFLGAPLGRRVRGSLGTQGSNPHSAGGKRSLALGVVGYGMFSSAALAYSSFGEPAWARVLVIAAGGANGVGAALLWTAQGRALLDCAARDPDYDVGRLFAVFWALFNLSAVFGGFVTFFYFSNTSSSGNAPLYLVFTVLIATGGAGCLLLEEDAPDVTNKDAAAARPVAEAKATLALFFNKKALLLLPLFWYTGYNQPYVRRADLPLTNRGDAAGSRRG